MSLLDWARRGAVLHERRGAAAEQHSLRLISCGGPGIEPLCEQLVRLFSLRGESILRILDAEQLGRAKVAQQQRARHLRCRRPQPPHLRAATMVGRSLTDALPADILGEILGYLAASDHCAAACASAALRGAAHASEVVTLPRLVTFHDIIYASKFPRVRLADMSNEGHDVVLHTPSLCDAPHCIVSVGMDYREAMLRGWINSQGTGSLVLSSSPARFCGPLAARSLFRLRTEVTPFAFMHPALPDPTMFFAALGALYHNQHADQVELHCAPLAMRHRYVDAVLWQVFRASRHMWG